MAGVQVELYSAGGLLLMQTVTGSDSSYSFEELTPGSYTVHFVLLPNHTFSPMNQGDDDLDSDADSNGNVSVTLVSGQIDTSIDAGMIPPGGGGGSGTSSIGNRVFYDSDLTGIQTPEPGVERITVQLLDANGFVLQTTTSGLSDSYSFTGLAAGNYYIRVVLAEFWFFPAQDQGSDDTLDSDVDEFGFTALITLGEDEVNDTIDIGIYAESVNDL